MIDGILIDSTLMIPGISWRIFMSGITGAMTLMMLGIPISPRSISMFGSAYGSASRAAMGVPLVGHSNLITQLRVGVVPQFTLTVGVGPNSILENVGTGPNSILENVGTGPNSI